MWQDLKYQERDWIGGMLIDWGDDDDNQLLKTAETWETMSLAERIKDCKRAKISIFAARKSYKKYLTDYPLRTTIMGFEHTDDSFTVTGASFSCGGSREFLGRVPDSSEGIMFSGYNNHQFQIVPPETEQCNYCGGKHDQEDCHIMNADIRRAELLSKPRKVV